MNKNSFLKLLLGVLAVAGLSGSPAAVEAHHKPGHLLGPPTSAAFSIVQPLAFGTISPEVFGGTLTVSNTGTVSVTGTVISLGGAFNSLLTVNSCAGSVTTLTLTNGVLTGPGADIVITNLSCIGPGGSSGSGSCVYMGTAGSDVVAVGGTVLIPSGQTPGKYNGTFDIIGTHSPAC